ncbi:MAG: D-alanyl-D-alanine carboxypeptidase/D-alanyl-D-alanine-endopeptidase [Rhodobacteraceae bacterium]|nr:D-alanyl-D-alanine carboxypeptidase/D-alanyl-D-alanine-endopeptidase [Paracoccaceae bacterium]
MTAAAICAALFGAKAAAQQEVTLMGLGAAPLEAPRAIPSPKRVALQADTLRQLSTIPGPASTPTPHRRPGLGASTAQWSASTAQETLSGGAAPLGLATAALDGAKVGETTTTDGLRPAAGASAALIETGAIPARFEDRPATSATLSFAPPEAETSIAATNVNATTEIADAVGGETPSPMRPRSGATGFALIDLDSRTVVERLAADTSFIPASVAKAPTSLYALETLGPDFTFETLLIIDGEIENGVLKGDLYLRADGDPTLDTSDLGVLARDLSMAGVSRVEGAFYYDAGDWLQREAINPLQPRHAAYNPPLSGLNLNFNRVLFEWKREKSGQYNVAMQAHAARRSVLAQTVLARVNSELPGDTPFRYSAVSPTLEMWEVARGALGKRGRRWLPVKRPALYAAATFRTLAEEYGVSMPEPSRKSAPGAGSGARLVARHASKPLSNILRGMLKYSTNLTAETVGLAASARRGLSPLSVDGSAQMMSSWLVERYGAIAGDGASLKNHSGLDPKSRMTPREAAHLMAQVGADNLQFDVFHQLLPKHGLRGLSGAEVRAKTGTMYYGRGLAGYLSCDAGARYAFAIFTSDIQRRQQFDATLDPEKEEKPKGGTQWLRTAKAIEKKLLKGWSNKYCT